jgi:hypothetical protein
VLGQVLAHEDEPAARTAADEEGARATDPAVLGVRYQTVLDEDLRARLDRAGQAAGMDLVG